MARTRTLHAPRRGSMRRPSSVRIAPELFHRDPEGIYPVHRQELMPIAMASLILGVLAFLVCAKNGWLLLYGDAVAHLGIARRILDARYPGLRQLGGVWLPLPHLLMMSFVQRLDWWQSGFAGAVPSLAAFIAGNLGLYRLTRRIMPPAWAFVAVLFMAMNPNLLYLSSTAMTEPLFLALFVWSTTMTMEAVDALRQGTLRVARMRMTVGAALTFAMVMTRYDGWIIGAVAWLIVAIAWLRSAPATRQGTATAFTLATLLTLLGPVLWFWYCATFQHDWLDFLRGPYSAAAIEKKTTPPGAAPYRGSHNPLRALQIYTRTAQVDAAALETGFLLMAAALVGAWLLWRQRTQRVALLLWTPLPFYVYSIAWGHVPIFIPQLYPHSYYNSRYGMELLPALAACGTLAMWKLSRRLKERGARTGDERGWMVSTASWMMPASLLLIVLNTVAMMGAQGLILSRVSGHDAPVWLSRPPLVFDEGVVNSRTRIPFEQDLARELLRAPAGSVVMIDTTDHIGAVQDAGLPLKQLISPLDEQSFDRARQDPARYANLVIALDKDPVLAAVRAHPQGLSEIEILCHTGQPCAHIYRSDRFDERTR